MYSIASIFSNQDETFWQSLNKTCEYGGLHKTAIPHFSWQSAESYQFDLVRAELSKISTDVAPFSFKTSGVGIFNNKRKIFFLIIVKNRALLEMHEMIWLRTVQFTEQANLHYSPENWIPHITLNLNELTEDQFKCSIDELTRKPMNFEFEVHEFGLLYLTSTSSGIDSLYPLEPDK